MASRCAFDVVAARATATVICFRLYVCSLLVEERHALRSAKQARRQQRRSQHQANSSPSSSVTELDRSDDTVSQTGLERTPRTTLDHSSDSDGEAGTTVIRPWTSNSQRNDAEDNGQQAASMNPELRALFEMINEDLDKFVYTPAPNGLGDVQCRITRDKRGMEKGLFPIYYMHVERPSDSKKVCPSPFGWTWTMIERDSSSSSWLAESVGVVPRPTTCCPRTPPIYRAMATSLSAN